MNTPGNLSTPRFTDTGSRFSNTNISGNSKPKSERLEMWCNCVRDIGQSDLCKNLGKFGSLPCLFKDKHIENMVMANFVDPLLRCGNIYSTVQCTRYTASF